LLLIIKIVTTALNANVLWTLRDINNVNEEVVRFVKSIGPERGIVDTVSAEVKCQDEECSESCILEDMHGLIIYDFNNIILVVGWVSGW
jgi:hypothetical protein